MSDTPETDEAQFGTGRVSVEFARRLERERDKYYNELLTKRGLCNVQEQVIIDWKAEAEHWREISK